MPFALRSAPDMGWEQRLEAWAGGKDCARALSKSQTLLKLILKASSQTVPCNASTAAFQSFMQSNPEQYGGGMLHQLGPQGKTTFTTV